MQRAPSGCTLRDEGAEVSAGFLPHRSMTDAQMQIIENLPRQHRRQNSILGLREALLEGTDAYASARGYYTYIYQPGRAGWQTVAVIGPEISDDEPEPQTHRAGIFTPTGKPRRRPQAAALILTTASSPTRCSLKPMKRWTARPSRSSPSPKAVLLTAAAWAISPARQADCNHQRPYRR